VGLKADMEKEVADVFAGKWQERDGNVVPEDDSLTLSNDAVKIEATVLYADLADSTKLVDGNAAFFEDLHDLFIAERAPCILAFDQLGDRALHAGVAHRFAG